MDLLIDDIWLKIFGLIEIKDIIRFKRSSKYNFELVKQNWHQISKRWRIETFLSVDPYDYQVYMTQCNSAIWKVEMGLGKTLAALMWIKKEKGNLIICPKNIINVWIKEIKEHFKGLSYFVYHYEYNNLINIYKKDLVKFNVVITTYSQVQSLLIKWNRIVFDECHKMTNHKNVCFSYILKLEANHFLAMSGTPIKNNKYEMNNLLKCLKSESKDITIISIKKEQVLNLPKCHIIEFFTSLGIHQSNYDNLIKDYKNCVVKKGNALALQEIMKLRQLCAISKINDIIDVVDSHETKVVIMSKFTLLLKKVKAKIKDSLLICGETKYKDRQSILSLFRSKDKYRVLLLNIDIGSEGIDLTCSNVLILTEPWWNKESHEQSISRIHRYGQEKECYVYKLLIKDSFETDIEKLCKKKNQSIESLI